MSTDPVAEPTDQDEVIAAAVLNGHRDRFAELVRRYHGPLLRLASHRVGQPAWAEELVQETFLAAYKSLHTFDPQYSFRSWLWTILLNQCRRALTRERRRDAIVARSPTGEDWEQGLVDERQLGPAGEAMRRDRDRRLNAMLEQLNEPQAEALRLRFFGDLKFREIADTMQCSLSTAKNRVRDGLLALSEQLRDEPSTTESNSPSGHNTLEP